MESLTLIEAKILSLSAAQAISERATGHAAETGIKVSVAIVDAGGHLLAFARMDRVHVGTVEVALAKARTSALFRRATADLAERLEGGLLGIMTIDGALALPGGVPLVQGGSLLGAIGVSGGSPDQDAEVAAAGAALLA